MRKFINLFTFILISFFCYGQNRIVVNRDTVKLNLTKVVVVSKTTYFDKLQTDTTVITFTKHIPTGTSIMINGKACQIVKDSVYTKISVHQYYNKTDVLGFYNLTYDNYMTDEEILNYQFSEKNILFAKYYSLCNKEPTVIKAGD